MALANTKDPSEIEDNKRTVIIYTDGACKGNPGPGGWGATIKRDDKYKELKGGEYDTTNNRMELMGPIKALQYLSHPRVIELYTDSKYVKDGITQWIFGWKNNGWKNASKKPVKNDDLWKKLDELVQFHSVEWKWVKGHSGDPGNERADELANLGVQQAVKAQFGG